MGLQSGGTVPYREGSGDIVSTVRKQREKRGCSAHFLLFILPPAHGMVPPTISIHLPASVNPKENSLTDTSGCLSLR